MSKRKRNPSVFSTIQRLAVCFVWLAAFGGCATIIHGGGEDVIIMSSPAGARVRIDSVEVGETPLHTSIFRNADHSIQVEKPGYRTATYSTTHSFSNWVVGNFCLGIAFPVGMIIDFATGGSQNLDVSKFYVTLKPVEKP